MSWKRPLTAASSNEELKSFYISLGEILAARKMNPLPDIEVAWTLRMGPHAWGKCYAKRDSSGRISTATKILLNQKVFAKFLDSRQEIEIESTIRHEAAHAWTATHCGRLDHSQAWRHIAMILGDTGNRFAGCNVVETLQAKFNHHLVPTQIESLSKRQIHSIRTSLALMCRRYGWERNKETFWKFVAGAFPHFSKKALTEAADIIFDS